MLVACAEVAPNSESSAGSAPTIAPAPAVTSVNPTPSRGLFSDDFESGDLARWTDSRGAVVQKQDGANGVYAVRAKSSGSPTDAIKQLNAEQAELYYHLRFNIISQGDNSVYLQRYRTAENDSVIGVYVSSTSKLGYRNDVTDENIQSTTLVSHRVWHDLQVHIRIDGATSQIEVWLDGQRVDALSRTTQLGTTRIDRIQLGDNAPGRAYDIAFDDVVVDTKFIDL
jgi:hypothetical protein